MNCPVLETCLFFNDKMATMPLSAEILKKEFCRNQFSCCARYVVFLSLGRDAVPLDLFPNEPKRAKAITTGE